MKKYLYPHIFLEIMALDYISSRITKEEFLEKIYSKSRSDSALETAKAHLNNLDYFCQDKYNRESIIIMSDLREDMERTRSPTKVLRFLDEFVKWLLVDHPNILLCPTGFSKMFVHMNKHN